MTQDLGFRVLGLEEKSEKCVKCEGEESNVANTKALLYTAVMNFLCGKDSCVKARWVDIFSPSNVHKKKRLSAVECISLQIHLKEIAQRLSWRTFPPPSSLEFTEFVKIGLTKQQEN